MSLQPILIRRIKSVTDLVTHQKVIHSVACLLPQRQGQHTGMNIKAGSLHLLVLNHKVFGGKKFSKLGLDFVADGHLS